MLEAILKQSGGVASGQVLESLLNGQYRVIYNGRQAIATSQAGVLSIGQQVVLSATSAGLIILSAGSVSSTTHTEVTISG